MLCKIFEVTNNVTKIKNAGKKKVLVYVSSFLAANKLVQNNVLDSYGHKSYIAKQLVSVTGIVAGIPTDLSNEEIMQGDDRLTVTYAIQEALQCCYSAIIAIRTVIRC